MSNEYFDATGAPGTSSSGSSAVIRGEYSAIEAAFGKLPALSGGNNRIVHVNSGGTALINTDDFEFDGSALTVPGSVKLKASGSEVMRITPDATNQTIQAIVGSMIYDTPSGAGHVFKVNGTAVALANASYLLSHKGVESDGQVQLNSASKVALSQESASTSCVTAFGADTSTYGVLDFRRAKSNGGAIDTLILDANGNAGLALSASAWGTNNKAVEIGSAGNAVSSDGNGYTHISNALYNDGSIWRYARTSAICLYEQGIGTHGWFGGASGTSGTSASSTLYPYFYTNVNVTNGSPTNADSVLRIYKSASTDRSISAIGTINASGADYAEYERKASDCGAVAKGQIIGFDENGEVTDLWARAMSFGVKSTNPSYVGGDAWGSDEDLGMTKPKHPIPPKPSSEADTPEARIEFQAQMAEYELALDRFNDRLEAARQRVDRVAYSGKVPVNVLGAAVGDYILPAQDGTGIKGIAVADPSFEQYRVAVGQVRKILRDGRALIAVKVG